MLRREAKIFIVGGKKEGATLGFWERVSRSHTTPRWAKDGFFSYRRAV
jgi:hypothetical protein